LYYGKEEADDNLSDYEKSGLDFVCVTEWSSFLHELHSGYYEKLFGGLTKNLLSNSGLEEGENKPYGWAYTSREGVSFLWNEKTYTMENTVFLSQITMKTVHIQIYGCKL